MEIFEALILLFAGVGVFLVGVELLSSNIEQLASTKIRDLFNKTANNKLINFGIGTATTAIIQSSGVTTVLIVGFVNVGAMSLYQASAMIMGACVGTTITAHIASLQAFKFTLYLQALAFLGMILTIVCKKDKIKKAGYIIAGLGFIFIGLAVMKDSMSGDKMKEILENLFHSVDNPFLLFLIGTIVTALAQSSSSTTSILVTMAAAGVVIGDGGNSVLFLILGANLGSCITALMSSLNANTNAKRAAMINLLFKMCGVTVFFILLVIFKNFNKLTFQKLFIEPSVQIAMFHTFFNVVCSIIFMPFCKQLVDLSKIIVKDKTQKEYTDITYLDERIINNTSMAIEQAKKESMLLGDEAIKAFSSAFNSFVNKDISKFENIYKTIEQCNNIDKRVTNYLIKLSAVSGYKEEKNIANIHNNVGDIMRIAEIADNFIKYTKRTVEQNLNFSEYVMEEVKEMYQNLLKLYDLTKKVVLDKDQSLYKEIDATEDKIDAYRKHLIDTHIERLNTGTCKPENSSIFINLVSNLERLGDHLTYIAYTEKK